MKRIPNEECASICGLFCGACPAFPNDCHGCFSDFVRENCKNCADHGFLDCATSHNVTRCYECGEFPCDKLREFSTKPIINGICNHANVIPDSMRMKEIGVSQWITEKIAEHKCPACGKLINWFEMTSHTCDSFAAHILLRVRNTISEVNSMDPKKQPPQEEKPIPGDIYPVIDTDLGRDNLENDLPAADLEDL